MVMFEVGTPVAAAPYRRRFVPLWVQSVPVVCVNITVIISNSLKCIVLLTLLIFSFLLKVNITAVLPQHSNIELFVSCQSILLLTTSTPVCLTFLLLTSQRQPPLPAIHNPIHHTTPITISTTAIPTTVTATAEHRTRLRDAPRTGAPVHINNKHMPTSPNGEPTGTGTNTANTGTGTNGLPVSLSDLTGNKGTPTGVGMHKNIKSTVVATGKAPPAALGVGHTGSSIPALQPQKRQTKLNVVKPSLQHAAETKGQSTATGTTAPTTISASPPQVPNTATMTAVVSTVQPASPAAVSPAVGAAAVGDGAAVGGGGAAVGGAAVGGGGAAVGGAAVGGG
eukprot:Lankesteria_metandrocarpae@DN729_c0_g1_i2.p2